MLGTKLCSYSTDMCVCVYKYTCEHICIHFLPFILCIYVCETDRQIHTHRNRDREGEGGRTQHVTEAGFLGLSALDSAC